MRQGYSSREILETYQKLDRMVVRNQHLQRQAEKEQAWQKAIDYHGTKFKQG